MVALTEATASGVRSAIHAARSKVVELNAGLVWKIAANMAPKYQVDVEDVAQYGFLGFLKALEKFDPTLGFALSTYAAQWIRAYINNGCEQEQIIRKPGNTCERHYKIRKYKMGAVTKLEREPTHEEIAEATGISISDVKVDAESPWMLESMDKENSADHTLHDMIPGEFENADHAATRTEAERKVQDLVASLPEREQRVLRARFSDDDDTLQTVANSMGISRERVRQLQVKALAKLRKKLNREDFR